MSPRRIAGHALTITWSGRSGADSYSTGTCRCGWTRSASNQSAVRYIYREHLEQVRALEELAQAQAIWAETEQEIRQLVCDFLHGDDDMEELGDFLREFVVRYAEISPEFVADMFVKAVAFASMHGASSQLAELRYPSLN